MREDASPAEGLAALPWEGRVERDSPVLCCCVTNWPTPVLLREGGIGQAGLKLADDRPEQPGREESRAQRAGPVLTDGR